MYCDLPDAMPETYIETTEFDCLHDEGFLYGKKLTDAGLEVTVNETKGTFHGYDSALDAQIVIRNVDRRTSFLRHGFRKTAERR
jgi:acetyl esterase